MKMQYHQEKILSLMVIEKRLRETLFKKQFTIS